MKKNIAIISGGFSSEQVVAEKSAKGIYSFIDKEQYNVYIVNIIDSNWTVQISDQEELKIDKNDFSFLLGTKKIVFDFAYITIHGTPGEDGILQGYFNLIGLPHSACDVLPASLSFNKFVCNKYLKTFGINIADAVLLHKGAAVDFRAIAQKTGFPCFVKPNLGGSSFGVTKVKRQEDLESAILKAFLESDQVIVESFLEGVELTCGIYKTKKKTTVLPVSEVVSENEFFDYDAKYNGQVEEITPARISDNLTLEVQQLTERIYELLSCKGIVRIDYIVDKSGIINLLEVNTTPGMTETSFIPQQAEVAGLEMKDLMSDIIEDAFT